MARFSDALAAGCPPAAEPPAGVVSRSASASLGGGWLAGNVECRNTVLAVGGIDQRQADQIEATGRIGAKR